MLHTSTGVDRRTVQAVGGYLSGRSARQHFGLPRASRIYALEIRWPDRTVSMIGGRKLEPNRWLTITRRAAGPAPSATSQSGSSQPTDAHTAQAFNAPTD